MAEHIPNGGTVILTLEVSDQANAPQDPSSVSVEYKDPTGTKTTTSSGIVHDSQGKYHFGLTLNITGRWVARWVGTGVFAGASPDVEFICDPSELA